MARPVTLFTGQWADLPFERVCALASKWGDNGLEIAASGDHFDVVRALEEDGYLAGWRAVLELHGLSVFTLSNHLVGQAVCDVPLDRRHQAILPARIWGDGEPEGVRQRAAEEMKATARAAAKVGGCSATLLRGSSLLAGARLPADAAWNHLAAHPRCSPRAEQRGRSGGSSVGT